MFGTSDLFSSMVMLDPDPAGKAGAGGAAAGAAAAGAGVVAGAKPDGGTAQQVADDLAGDAGDDAAGGAGDDAADEAFDPGKIGATAIADFTKRHGYTPQEAKRILREAKRAKAAAKTGGDDADADATGAGNTNAIDAETKRALKAAQAERDQALADYSATVDEAYANAPAEVVEMLEEAHEDLEEKSPRERKALLTAALKMHEAAEKRIADRLAAAAGDTDEAKAAAKKAAAKKAPARGAIPGHTPGTSSNEATISMGKQLFEKAMKTHSKTDLAAFDAWKKKHPGITVSRLQ